MGKVPRRLGALFVVFWYFGFPCALVALAMHMGRDIDARHAREEVEKYEMCMRVEEYACAAWQARVGMTRALDYNDEVSYRAWKARLEAVPATDDHTDVYRRVE